MRLTLTQRLSLVFVALLLACSAVSAWLQIRASMRHEQVVVQRVSFGLADHIAGRAQLMDASGWRPDAVRTLFSQLMAVNPSVELYLLDNQGRIVGDAAPSGHLKRRQIDLEPIRRFLSGARLPILGDDPRSTAARKVFSVAPVRVDGRNAGYVYVVLQGETHDTAVESRVMDGVLAPSLLTLGLVGLLALVMGLLAFRLITRPLRALTQAVRQFDANGEKAAALADTDADHPPADEISILREAFAQMGRRIAEQWQALARQDQQRRDLMASISHDLRTPLTSLHGYLETLRIKDHMLGTQERHRYLDIAIAQSAKVGHLAQELFELARLESGLVRPELEIFSLAELAQDVTQKYALAAQARGQAMSVDMTPLPPVRADLAMVERVLTNLLDNAIRHNPSGTRIQLRLRAVDNTRVEVDVMDDGPPLPEAVRNTLFEYAPQKSGGGSGGLGLIVVQRLLMLQGEKISLVEQRGQTIFRFYLPMAKKGAQA
ncbi:HAMP domain-containing histidine kinase [Allopusillimonas soli]|uniref:histidine kinase n=1 Tax=Allopusillimonas soli TaxID=659016 RepID=A0A853FDQ8_9BURK|nr:HAMP domain-containing sensor histidine kinase [Allopusillimonas soli]NYT38995.1 HAMP domain-containing histidine kinase [Allopusillimonas soli]TEA69601.1 HAMP domain-containing histidine kinase [Allopusillimonas soli]